MSLSPSPGSTSSSEPAKPSGRKGSRKVRTGCITCKCVVLIRAPELVLWLTGISRIRKVKCDEGKPFCNRCVKTGRRCDGYETARRPSPNHLALSLSHSPEFTSADEFHAFDYYRTRSAPALGRGIDGDFWGGSVLRLCLTEPTVRHAVLALSSLHEYVNVQSATSREIGKKFAFLEYGKAISALRTWDSHDEPAAIPLLVCVLFTCIEFLLGHETASQLHICQGRQVLSSLKATKSNSLDMIKRELVPFYARLCLASFTFGSRPPAIPDHLKLATSLPNEFTSFREARNHLYHLLDDGLHFTTHGKPAVYAMNTAPGELAMLKSTQQGLLSGLSQWNIAFTLLAAVTPSDGGWVTTQQLLRLYYHAAVIWVSTALDSAELAYDAHISAFATIISIATSVLNSKASTSEARPFGFETELIAPVYWTAAKCRHPLLRRAALRLLMRDELKERKENLWYGRHVLAAASRIIELEEAGSTLARTNVAEAQNNRLGGHSDRAKLHQLERFDGELSISVFLPPQISCTFQFDELPVGEADGFLLSDDRLDLTARRQPASSQPDNAIDRVRTATLKPVSSAIEPPFDLPESARIKNAAVGPRQSDGVWITIFKDPVPGQLEWSVDREFLKI